MPRKTAPPSSQQGTYVYDRKLKKLVRVSDDIPGVSGRAKKSSAPEGGCGRRGGCRGGGCGR